MKRSAILNALFLILLSFSTYAASIGVSPGRVDIGKVSRDGYSENYLLVSTSSGNVTITVNVKSSDGNFREFVHVVPMVFNISRGNPRNILVYIEPPEDAPVGNYTGLLEITAVPAVQQNFSVGSTVRTFLGVAVRFEVTGEYSLKCGLSDFRLSPAEYNHPVEIGYSIRNTGTVKIRPGLSLDIFSDDQSEILFSTEFVNAEILPTQARKFRQKFRPEIRPAEYWLYVRMEDCGYEDIFRFTVFPEGYVTDRGDIQNISMPENVNLSEIVPIAVDFRNTGERVVNARIAADVYRNGELVSWIEGDSVDIFSSESEKLLAYYTPEQRGDYSINVKVIYNNRTTPSQVINLTVGPENQIEKKQGLFLAVVLAAFFIIMLKRRRQNYGL